MKKTRQIVIANLMVFAIICSGLQTQHIEAASISKTVITSVKSSSQNTVTVKYKKTKSADGYQITYATNPSFGQNKKSVMTKSLSKTVKNLKAGKTYYFKVRGYQEKATGKKQYGAYSKVNSVTVKKGMTSLKLDKTVTGTLKKGDSFHQFKIKHSVASVYGVTLSVYSNYGDKYEWILSESDGNIFFDSYLFSTDGSVKDNVSKKDGWYLYKPTYSSHHSTGTYTYTLSVPEYMFMDEKKDLKLYYKLTLDTSLPYPY